MTVESIEKFLMEVGENAATIDKDSVVLKHFLLRANEIGMSRRCTSTGLIPNQFLYEIYSNSYALGFTYAQHLIAFERITRSVKWQTQNPALWSRFQRGESLIGLATTYLGTASRNLLSVKKIEGGFNVNGIIPWSTGARMFEALILALETKHDLIYVAIPFPSVNDRSQSASANLVELIILDGTSTAVLKFKDFSVPTRRFCILAI